MRARTVWLSLAILLFSLFVSSSADALPTYVSGATGVDVSWPSQNCIDVQHLPSKTSFGIVGVNHGLDFTYNTCLSQEADSFSHYSLYLNTGYPGISYGRKYESSPRKCSWFNNECLAYNYGFNDAKRSIKYADLSNAHATTWWLDVETDNSWTNNPFINVASLQGMIAAVKQYTVFSNIGFYSLPAQWEILTGNWDNGYEAWAATGMYDRSSAVSTCNEPSFTGGKLLLTQYTLKLDEDYVC